MTLIAGLALVILPAEPDDVGFGAPRAQKEVPLIREAVRERTEGKRVAGQTFQEIAETAERQADVDLRLALDGMPERAFRIEDLQVGIHLGKFSRAAGMDDQGILDGRAERPTGGLGQGHNMKAGHLHESSNILVVHFSREYFIPVGRAHPERLEPLACPAVLHGGKR